MGRVDRRLVFQIEAKLQTDHVVVEKQKLWKWMRGRLAKAAAGILGWRPMESRDG